MTHPDIGPELRQLAAALLDRLDPAVRAAAAAAGESLRGPGRCQQVWCPVCAVAALLAGEEHPMLTVLAEHSVTWVTALRAMVAEPAGADVAAPGDTDEPVGGERVAGEPPAADDDAPPPTQNGRYHNIPIIVEPIVDLTSDAS